MTSLNFFVIQGLRSLEDQKKFFEAGKSTTMNSRHLTGHAVDLGVYKGVDSKEVDWTFRRYTALNVDMMNAAAIEDVPLTWGGAWKTFKDGVHWELPRLSHPVS